MKPLEAEKLLGGHAAGILSEAERRALFEAALEHQELFDALADQEVLRELLADPASRAQLLAALAPAKRSVPLWRHPALLGAAASLLVAATAGLAYLRSPQPLAPRLEPPVLQEAPGAKDLPAGKEAAPIAPAPREERLQKLKVAPSPAAPTQVSPPPPPSPPAEAQAVVEVLSRAPEAVAAPKVLDLQKAQERNLAVQERNLAVQERAEALPSRPAKAAAPMPSAVAAPAAVPAGVPGGVIGGVAGGASGSGVRVKKAEASAAKADLLAPGSVRGEVIPPAWNLETLPDGKAQLTVLAPPYAQALLLQRGPAGLRVVKLLKIDGPGGSLLRWRAQLSLEPGDTVDLYLLNSPVADPTKLPEDGPVDGFRARVHPTRR